MLIADFINVGYGDSILLRYKGGNDKFFTILVDGGVSEDEHYKDSKTRIKSVDYLLHQSVDYIDLLIITHLHKDHIGGLVAVVDNFPVKEIWLNINLIKKYYGSEIKEEKPLGEQSRDMLNSINDLSYILKVLQEKGTNIYQIQGDIEEVPFGEGLKLTAYHGISENYDRQDEIIKSAIIGTENLDGLLLELDGLSNSISMPVKVECHDISLLLGADVDFDFWRGKKLSRSHILKLPHHGREDSITPELAKIISPKYVIISVSETGTDDIPSPKAMEAFSSCDDMPEILCTDEVEVKSYCMPTSQRAIRFNICDGGVINKEFVIF